MLVVTRALPRERRRQRRHVEFRGEHRRVRRRALFAVHHRAVVRRAPHGVHHPSQHVRGGYGTERSAVRGSFRTRVVPRVIGDDPTVSRRDDDVGDVGVCALQDVALEGGDAADEDGRGLRRVDGVGVFERDDVSHERAAGEEPVGESREFVLGRRELGVAERADEEHVVRGGGGGGGGGEAWRAGDGGGHRLAAEEHLRTQGGGLDVLDDASLHLGDGDAGRALPERELDAEGMDCCVVFSMTYRRLHGLSGYRASARSGPRMSAAPRRALGRARRGVPSPGKPRRRGFRYQLYARDRRQRRAPETSFGRVLRSSARAHLGASPKVTVPWRRS